MFVCRNADSVTFELKLAVADLLAKWYFASKLVQVLVLSRGILGYNNLNSISFFLMAEK